MNRTNFSRQPVIAAAALVAALAFPSAARAQEFTPALDLPVNYPHIVFDGSLASRIQYDAPTKLFKIDASAIQLTYGPGQLGYFVTGDTSQWGTFAVRALVDNVVNTHGQLGKLIGGVAPALDATNDACGVGNGDDFCIKGNTFAADGVTPISGVLLRGEVVDFGAIDQGVHVFFNGIDNIVDNFEMHIQLKGGLLMPKYPSGHLVVWAWGFHDQLERLPEFTGTFATSFGNVADGTSGETDLYVAPLPPPPPPVVYAGTVQPPINANGSSVYTAKRGVVPVKFSLTKNGVATCELPPATISLERISGGTLGAITQDTFIQPSDIGSNFRIDFKACQYVYNLGVSTLGPGTYVARISVNALAVGNATFNLK